jgi:DNA-directed RNA polymerase specialized sigma24 family protein
VYLPRVGEPTIAETRAELGELLKDRDRKKKLYALAAGFARGSQTADDLVNTAVMKLLSGATPWRTSKHPDLVAHLGSVMFTVADHVRTSADARRQRKFHTPEEEDGVRDDRAGAQEQLLDDEAERRTVQKLGRWMRTLREHSADDRESLGVLDCFARDILKPAAQATELGWRIEDLRRVRKRLLERAETVMRDHPDDSGQYVARGAEP